MIQIHTTISDIPLEQWNNLLRLSPVANFFQTKECYELYGRQYFMTPFVYAVSENDALKGVVVGYIQKDGGRLKQFFSQRAIINGGPLLAENISEEALRCLLSRLQKELKRKAIYLEFRNFNDYSRWRNCLEQAGFAYQPHYNFHIDTTSLELVETNMNKSPKRNVKIAFKTGAVIDENPTAKDIDDYYSLLLNLYTTKVKTPLFPKSFFEDLYRNEFCKFLIVKYNGEVIGGAVLVKWNSVVYEWFKCGEDRLYKHTFPSTLATYGGIKYAAENGFLRFDMMGAGAPGDGGYGVRDFKASFGGILVEYGRYIHLNNLVLFTIGKAAVKIIKKIK